MPVDPYEPSFSKDDLLHEKDLLHLIFGENGCSEIGIALRDDAFSDPLSVLFQKQGNALNLILNGSC